MMNADAKKAPKIETTLVDSNDEEQPPVPNQNTSAFLNTNTNYPRPASTSARERLLQIQKQRKEQLNSIATTSLSSPTSSRSFLSPSGPVVPGGRGDKGLSVPQGVFPAMDSPQRMNAPGAGPRRQKVSLKPGHSAMDWETRKKTTNVKGIDPSDFPLRVTKEELRKHNKDEDFWICLNRKVYNLTPYLNYHPGGVDILKSCAGRDGTVLFNKYHRWVNFERILDECFIGFMI